jgi:SAM-dependent methyltransferase
VGQAARKKRILAPLQRIGLNKINDIAAGLKEQFGEAKAEEIMNEWERLSALPGTAEGAGAQNALYEYLNSDFALSMLVACYTDAAIIRQFALWIYEHRELFGGTILDVGCGTGILTCFLALVLPEARIVAVDRSENCIRTARKIQEIMQAENVEFCRMTAEELQGRTFSTVLSARTFHENIGIRRTEYRFRGFSEQAEIYRQIYLPYCRTLSERTAPGGTLICMERNHMDTEFYGMLQALADCGCRVRPDSLTELSCEESDFREKSSFLCMAADRTACGEADAEPDALDREELFRVWSERAFSRSGDPEHFTRPQTDWYVEQHAGELLEGYATYDDSGTQLARACLYRDRSDPDVFLMHQANYGQAGVQVLPMEALGEAREIFADHRRVDAARGFQVRPVI